MPNWPNLSIAHIDCDAFYASVEKRDNPDLRDKPVIIGGGKRGVVSTACYHRAHPRGALCHADVQGVASLPAGCRGQTGYGEICHASGARCAQLMLEMTPLVEPLSIDEAFLDLSGTERLHHATPAYHARPLCQTG